MNQSIEQEPNQLENNIENYEEEKKYFIKFIKEEAVNGELTLEQILDGYDRKITKEFLDELVKDETLETEERNGETYYSLKEETLENEPSEDFEQLDQAD